MQEIVPVPEGFVLVGRQTFKDSYRALSPEAVGAHWRDTSLAWRGGLSQGRFVRGRDIHTGTCKARRS